MMMRRTTAATSLAALVSSQLPPTSSLVRPLTHIVFRFSSSGNSSKQQLPSVAWRSMAQQMQQQRPWHHASLTLRHNYLLPRLCQ